MRTNKKTKIICTIGPATDSLEVLKNMLDSGMNIARMNFSHGDWSEQKMRMDYIRKASESLNIPVAILQDLSGPKIRIGEFKNKKIFLKEGQNFTLTTKMIIGDEDKVFINYPLLPREVKKGDYILIQDGRKKLKVLNIIKNEILCKVVVGGELGGKRGVNLPGSNLSIGALTAKDKKDLEFGAKNKVDFVALSFVRKSDDILKLKNELKKLKFNPAIIAKIETPQAVENIDEIIKLSDGIMVARGDLAIEIGPEQVPLVQKEIIRKCNIAGKPVITATQVLESMIQNPIPTRAEISDVANAILDGTDAVMLSEETTLGKYPVQAVSVISKVARRIEGGSLHKRLALNKRKITDEEETVVDSICNEVIDVAERIKAKFIVALTDSGKTASMVSRYKPSQGIIAITSNKQNYNKMLINFGCFPVITKRFKHLADVVSFAKNFLKEHNLAVKDDKIVFVTGLPLGQGKETNSLLVEQI
ncbi:pyruvate kinase [Candidatus Nomurabacteria bacterium]|nr:pyruvate kinase [Candidatus Nomurabacteria bacterium]